MVIMFNNLFLYLYLFYRYVPLGGNGRLGKHVTQIGYWSNGRPIEKNHVNNNKVSVNYHNLINDNDMNNDRDDDDNEKEDFVDGVSVTNNSNIHLFIINDKHYQFL